MWWLLAGLGLQAGLTGQLDQQLSLQWTQAWPLPVFLALGSSATVDQDVTVP